MFPYQQCLSIPPQHTVQVNLCAGQAIAFSDGSVNAVLNEPVTDELTHFLTLSALLQAYQGIYSVSPIHTVYTSDTSIENMHSFILRNGEEKYEDLIKFETK